MIRFKHSSWLLGTTYTPTITGRGTLTVHLINGTVLVYYDVPYWLRGVLHGQAAQIGAGRGYNRVKKILKGVNGWSYRRIVPVAEEPGDELYEQLQASLAA